MTQVRSLLTTESFIQLAELLNQDVQAMDNEELHKLSHIHSLIGQVHTQETEQGISDDL